MAQSSFEPKENLRAAWMHYYLGIDQHLIASSFAINSGRVNEACRAIEYAMKDPKRVLAILDKHFKAEKAVEVEVPVAQAPANGSDLPLLSILSTFNGEWKEPN